MTIIMQTELRAMGLVSLWWFFIGFSLCFGQSGGVIGNSGTYIALTNAAVNVIGGVPLGQIPAVVYCVYQLTFAIVTPALMTGVWVPRS